MYELSWWSLSKKLIVFIRISSSFVSCCLSRVHPTMHKKTIYNRFDCLSLYMACTCNCYYGCNSVVQASADVIDVDPMVNVSYEEAKDFTHCHLQ